jgi:hypothetical protein
MKALARLPLCVGLVIGVLVGRSSLAHAQVNVGNSGGGTWDWLLGTNSLFLLPGESQYTTISVYDDPLHTPMYTGPVDVSAQCCNGFPSMSLLTPSGFSVSLAPLQICTRGTPRIPGQCWFEDVPGITTVDVSPGSSSDIKLHLRTAANATPGRYLTTLEAMPTQATSTSDVIASVLPGWPADGPAPACLPGLEVIALGTLDPIAWKRQNPSRTTYTVGVGLQSIAAGMEFTVEPLTTTPVPQWPDDSQVKIAIINFTNTAGFPVTMRTSNSANCAAPSQSIDVAAGQTQSLAISTNDTTTLIFSKRTCRAVPNLFNCYNGAGLGSDDFAEFSEGPFWALFGGRMVDISTVGDWGALPAPNAVRGFTSF